MGSGGLTQGGYTIAARDSGRATLDGERLEKLRACLRGPLLFPGDSGFDAATVLWNGMGGSYINFQTADEDDARIQATYGDNFDRLAEIKGRYDPDNLFRANRNIRPRE